MNDNYFHEIETARLRLCRVQKSDWKEISFLRSDKTVNHYVRRPRAETKEKALDYIAQIHAKIDNQKVCHWKITQKGRNQMIGSICLWNFSRNEKKAEVGYDLCPEFQGRGIMDESLKSVLDYGFDRLHLQTIEAYTHKLNEKSIKLLERNDFKLLVDKIDEDNTDNIIYTRARTM